MSESKYKREAWSADTIAYLRTKLSAIEQFIPGSAQTGYYEALSEIALDLGAQNFDVGRIENSRRRNVGRKGA